MQWLNELNSTQIRKLSRNSWRGNKNAKRERKIDKERRVSEKRCFKLSSKLTRNCNSRHLFHSMQIKWALIYKMTHCNCSRTRACPVAEKEDKLEIKHSNQLKLLINHRWIMLKWASKQKIRTTLLQRRRLWSNWETSSMTASTRRVSHHLVDHSRLLTRPNLVAKIQTRKGADRIKSLNWSSFGTARRLSNFCWIRISCRILTPIKWSISLT